MHVSSYLQDRVTGISHSRWSSLHTSTPLSLFLQVLPSLESGNTNSLVTQARNTGAGADAIFLFSPAQLLTHRSFQLYLPNVPLTYAAKGIFLNAKLTIYQNLSKQFCLVIHQIGMGQVTDTENIRENQKKTKSPTSWSGYSARKDRK